MWRNCLPIVNVLSLKIILFTIQRPIYISFTQQVPYIYRSLNKSPTLLAFLFLFFRQKIKCIVSIYYSLIALTINEKYIYFQYNLIILCKVYVCASFEMEITKYFCSKNESSTYLKWHKSEQCSFKKIFRKWSEERFIRKINIKFANLFEDVIREEITEKKKLMLVYILPQLGL